MNSLYQKMINSIKAKIAPWWTKIELFTSPEYLKGKIFVPGVSFFQKATDLRPRDKDDYYQMLGFLISKRLAFVLAALIGVLSIWYVTAVQPLKVFISDENGIKTYAYNSLPLRFTDGKVKILGQSGYLAYEGEVKGGNVSGFGVLYRKDGTRVYEGEFAENKFQGNGTSYYPTEQVQYVGSFQKNLYHGEGSLYRKNGSLEYAGEFLEGKKDGEGILYDSSNNEIYQGKFSKDQLLYGDFLGKSTKEANSMYSGDKTIYMNEEHFVVNMEGIDAVYVGNRQEENLLDEVRIDGIYLLKDTFEYAGEELNTIYDINYRMGNAVYEGNSYVTMPEAVAIHILNTTGEDFYGDVLTDIQQYLSDAVIVNSFAEDYGVYIYTYIQEGIRYTFFCEDKSGKFFMYLMEKQ